MEYGRMALNDLEKADTGLPADAPGNSLVLQAGKGGTKIYMGTPKWGRKEWIGKLYPRGTRESQYLEQYVKHYNAVELNSTHYKAYSPEEINKWKAKANNRNFKFCPKVWNAISHYSRFDNTTSLTNEFLNGVRAFEENLGPIFLQLSERYSPGQGQKFVGYLKTLPGDLQFFTEVRHPEWFDSGNKVFFDTLRSLKIGAVITDALPHREVLHMQLTLPKAFIRFSCQGDHHTDISRIDDWIKRIKEWQDKGLEECYFFVHSLIDAFSPEVTKYAARQFNKVCNANLPEIELLTLF